MRWRFSRVYPAALIVGVLDLDHLDREIAHAQRRLP
jgi:hypothetical protein